MCESVADPGVVCEASADLAEARRRAEAMADARAELRRECAGAAVRWAWARSGSAYQRLQPLYAERYGAPGAKWLRRPPRGGADADEYAFDNRERVVVAREHGGGVVQFEELIQYDGDTMIGHRYHGDGEPVGCTITRVHDGRVVHHVDAHAGGGYSIERYHWERSRVVRIVHVSEYRVSGNARVHGCSVHTVSYDDRGAVAEIVDVTDPDAPRTVYRPGAGPSAARLHQDAEDRLVAIVPEVLKGLPCAGAACRAALVYDPVNPLRAALALGGEPECAVWDPSLFPGRDSAPVLADCDAMLGDLCDAIAAHGYEELPEQARRTLNRAARRLNERGWCDVLEVTDDFAVYAVDAKLAHLEENLREAIPHPLRRRLRRKGVWPGT